MEMAKVTSKGQITIPVSIRRRLQIKEGDNLLFIDRPEGVVMVNPEMLPGERSVAKAPKPAKSAPAAVVAGNEKTPEPGAGAPAEVDADRAQTPEPDVGTPAEGAAASQDAQPPAKEPESPGKQLQGLDLKELLNEIRNIGSNI